MKGEERKIENNIKISLAVQHFEFGVTLVDSATF